MIYAATRSMSFQSLFDGTRPVDTIGRHKQAEQSFSYAQTRNIKTFLKAGLFFPCNEFYKGNCLVQESLTSFQIV